MKKALRIATILPALSLAMATGAHAEDKIYDRALAIAITTGNSTQHGSGCIVKASTGKLFLLTTAHLFSPGQESLEYYSLGTDSAGSFTFFGRQSLSLDRVPRNIRESSLNLTSNDQPVWIPVDDNPIDEARALTVRPHDQRLKSDETLTITGFPSGGPISLQKHWNGSEVSYSVERGFGTFTRAKGPVHIEWTRSPLVVSDFHESVPPQGMSGACVTDEEGRVVGVFYANAAEDQSRLYFVPLVKIVDFPEGF